jgi:DNA-binding winged helix-turn-helix (wHTH) protein
MACNRSGFSVPATVALGNLGRVWRTIGSRLKTTVMRIRFDRFTFDSDTRELLDAGRRVHVSPKAFDVLHVLLERRPSVVTKTELQDRVWPGTFVGDANLSVVIADIRQALGDDSKDSAFIRTVHRVGYAFCGDAVDLGASHRPIETSPYRRCWVAWNGKTFQLSEGENIVGRDPRSGVWIDASGVSKRHARILVSPDGATLDDLDSSNGTFVRGKRLGSGHQLADGDEIELGTATIRFRMWSDEQPPKTERVAGRKRG